MKFINITREEFLSSKLLYKYMSLEKTLNTLNDKYLWFANPTTWKDPFESRFINAKYFDGKEERQFKWKNRIYCICMSQTIVSEAAWRIYSPSDIGVQLRINRDVLLKELKGMESEYDVYIGKVEYMKTDDIIQNLSDIPFAPPKISDINTDTFAARLFMLKRIAFQYEDEIRIVLVSKDEKNAKYRKGVRVPYGCDNTKLIQRIVLDPEIGNLTADMIRNVLIDKYGFASYTKTNGVIFNRVIQSKIYNDNSSKVIHF